nr:serine racemase VanT catalytic subunit [Maliibacterium massiliense]
MKTEARYAHIDRFRMVAALLIVAIHTSPLLRVNQTLDFALTRVVARVAVPFFLMVTGYFVLVSPNKRAVRRFLQNTGLLYAAATLLYLPVNLYAGHLNGATLLKDIFFDGTFYHLWYLPAAILGVLLVCVLMRACGGKATFAIACALYALGMLGDSYYGLIAQIPWLKACYDAVFTVSSYTRNGIFYAPLFLCMGAALARHGARHRHPARTNALLLALFLVLMLAEGLTLHHFAFQRHDSMYVTLPLCMYFLFQLLLTPSRKNLRTLRDMALGVYILHPLAIILVRGAAKAVGLTALLVDNNLLHYIAVCLLSLVMAYLLVLLLRRLRRPAFSKGRAWAEIDLANLRHNVSQLRRALPEGCVLMPAIKADAYGHGAVRIARALRRQGVKAFCVASVSEGVALRKRGIWGEILVLGYTHPQQLRLLRRYRLSQTVVDSAYAQMLRRYGKKLRVHIKIDTGMHRLGTRCEDIEAIRAIFTYQNLAVQGMYTHLCVSDTTDEASVAFTKRQIDHFYAVADALTAQGLPLPKLHVQGSYGVLHYPKLACDYARVGIALYGVLSNQGDDAGGLDLRPLLALKARVESVRPLYSHECAGYGLQYAAEDDRLLAAVAIGYADGVPRSLSCGRGAVLIRGARAPIVGRICMDQLLVDVTGIADVAAGDVAVLIGRSGSACITACEMAQQADTISNEILSRLGSRLERIYLHP